MALGRKLVPLLAALVLAGCGSSASPMHATSAGATTSGVAGASATRKVPAPALAFQQALVHVVQVLSPSVVQISTSQGLGSGVVFDSKGDIVTNHHVVEGGSSLRVTTAKGANYSAKLVGSFAPDDLAVVRVPASANLRPATFADSSKLQIGDIAIAIGNPLGLQSSVTEGIVSARRAAVPEGNGATLPSVIQTSAPINPGNSGGALADLRGQVIGIPTLAVSDPQLGGAAVGIGFAIPSNLVKDIASQIVQHGHVVNSHRAFLGVSVGSTNGQGVYVGQVQSGGPAAKAGMQAGEVIVAVNGKPTPTLDALSAVLATLKPGKTAAVTVLTQNGQRKTLHVTLGSYPGT